MEYKNTRGHRNNNPLNIRKGSRWIGLSGDQSDKDFCRFDSLLYGFRAAFVLIRTHQRRSPLTVTSLIRIWSPPCENPTSDYVRYVCGSLSVRPDDYIRLEDKRFMVRLVSMMAFFESSNWYDLSLIADAYDLAYNA